MDVGETKEQKLPPPKFPDKKRRKATPAGGYKVKDVPVEEGDFNLIEEEIDLKPFIYKMEKKMMSILDNIRKDRKVSDYGGRGIGRRIKVASSQKGRYVSYRRPRSQQPKSIALDATIRNYLKNMVMR